MDIKKVNEGVIAQFRAGGEIEGMHRDRLLLLTTTGRRSGRPHTSPMMFHREGDEVLVIASNMGAPQHPAWYLNLAADPAVHVELPDEEFDGTAHAATGTDRDRRWSMITQLYPFFAEHEQQTDREIPVVVLTRSDTD
ncbi:nitroreductase family deazaflavin-dependent oxidoreductase [Nakamurella sp. YIM 132087]|uniref:Nitroreductase family deazaflavin-dependent oxidoreductase n=1 Tax=Nakamurella alba TaxID=2665158 RepID=A0A7K1FTB9_9ACTN|nr:nitroreductase family deazaflavin-dependent oxidoreductase [Nakamurella alba]MTD17407.1 nitroreductase family deazaflavin-dependent oxidoreductase [Nakamurella alba]